MRFFFPAIRLITLLFVALPLLLACQARNADGHIPSITYDAAGNVIFTSAPDDEPAVATKKTQSDDHQPAFNESDTGSLPVESEDQPAGRDTDVQGEDFAGETYIEADQAVRALESKRKPFFTWTDLTGQLRAEEFPSFDDVGSGLDVRAAPAVEQPMSYVELTDCTFSADVNYALNAWRNPRGAEVLAPQIVGNQRIFALQDTAAEPASHHAFTVVFRHATAEPLLPACILVNEQPLGGPLLAGYRFYPETWRAHAKIELFLHYPEPVSQLALAFDAGDSSGAISEVYWHPVKSAQ